MEKTTSIKFFWNGIKINGSKKLIKCYYSIDNNADNAPTVSISARDYDDLPRDIFTVTNETDIYADYFENDRATLTPAHPLYKYARYAAERAAIRACEWYIRDMSERIATQPAFYARDDFYKNEVEDRRRKLAELQAHKNPGHPTAADLAAVEAMNTAAENARREAEQKAEQERREKYLAGLAEDNRIISDILNSSDLDGLEKISVTIEWSENGALERIKGTPMTVDATEAIFSKLNKKYTADETRGYDKTSFIIAYTDENGEPCTYEGRYDIGSDSDSLIEHVRDFAKWQEDDRNPYGSKEDAENIRRLADLMEGQIKRQDEPANPQIVKIEVAPWVKDYNTKKRQEVKTRTVQGLEHIRASLAELTAEQLAEGVRLANSAEVAVPFLMALMGRDVVLALEMTKYINDKFNLGWGRSGE